MNRRWVLLLGTVSLGLVFLSAHVLRSFSLTGDEIRRDGFLKATIEGVRLSSATLQPGERIVIEHISIGHRNWEGHTYAIDGGEPKQCTIIERAISLDDRRGVVAGAPLLATGHPLSVAQTQGIDALLGFLRQPQGDSWRGGWYDTYDIEYLRDGRTIGRERLIDFGFWLNMYLYRPYAELPAELQAMVTPTAWARLRAFRDLRNELRKGVPPRD